MSRSARSGLLAAVSVAVATFVSPTLTAPADALGGSSVAVYGRLVVVATDGGAGHTSYAVELGDGDLVPVRGTFAPTARTGDLFAGRLALPSAVVTSLRSRDESGASAALALVDRRGLTLDVVGTPSVVASPAAAVTPTTHQQYVATLDNKGALGQTDSDLLGEVGEVGGYWTTESNGAISAVGVPSAVTHYDTALSTTDCGLGSDFSSVYQEAMKKFPGIDPFGGTDQLVLFVPSTCGSGTTVGEGTIGRSFASGGVVIVKTGDVLEGTYAHEAGHNYGFQHAYVRAGASSLEYYGVYDVMGFALAGFNQLTALSTPYRVFQGVTDSGEIQDVDVGDGQSPLHVSATIRPRGDTSGVRSVRVPDPATGEALYLDYRSGTGPDADAFYADTTDGLYLGSDAGPLYYAPGVTVNAAHGTGGSDTLVLDADGDTSLGAGGSWSTAGGRLTVTVTSIDASGAHVSIDVAPGITPSPVPTVSGTPRVGSRLTAAPGTWMDGVSLSYQWYAGGSPVAGATGTSYTPTASDVGSSIHVEVTGTADGYPDTTRESAGTAAVGRGILRSSVPTVTGRTRVGRSLTARPGTWTAGTTLRFAWYADGRVIRHQAAATLRLTRAQHGHRITVRVTGTKPGYTKVSRTSARTTTVR